MRSVGVFGYMFVFVLLAVSASAAIIHGSVYDLLLERVDNALVEINTTPKQVIVSQNGSYSFNVANGDYGIKAKLMQKNSIIAFVQENITIKQEGSYVLDLILFPDVEEGVEDIALDVNGNIVDNRNGTFAFAAILIVVVAIALLFYFKKIKRANIEKIRIEENKEEKVMHGDPDLEDIIKIIKNEGGRTTQKDIRKQIPLSEAKISLMIAELEHKGVIEKIKKGRGNIIILKKVK